MKNILLLIFILIKDYQFWNHLIDVTDMFMRIIL